MKHVQNVAHATILAFTLTAVSGALAVSIMSHLLIPLYPPKPN